MGISLGRLLARRLKAQPLLVIYRGLILWDNARREQLGELEILGAVRNAGVAAVEDVLALVLEPDGSFSCLPMSSAQGKKVPTALKDVKGVPEFSDDATLETKRRMSYPAA